MFFPLCLYFSSSFLFSLGCCRFYKDFFPALYIQIQEIKYTIHTHIYTCLYLCLHIVMTNYKYITMFSLNKRNNKNDKINTKIYQQIKTINIVFWGIRIYRWGLKSIDIVEVIYYRLVVQIHINGLYYRIFAHVNLSIVFADRITCTFCRRNTLFLKYLCYYYQQISV